MEEIKLITRSKEIIKIEKTCAFFPAIFKVELWGGAKLYARYETYEIDIWFGDYDRFLTIEMPLLYHEEDLEQFHEGEIEIPDVIPFLQKAIDKLQVDLDYIEPNQTYRYNEEIRKFRED